MTRSLLSLEDALGRLLDGVEPVGTETVTLDEAVGRVLAGDVSASRDQPPAPLSAMDGYALRGDDAQVGRALRVIGESVGGAPFAGTVETGEAVRIATGALIPAGADRVVVQEDCERDGAEVRIVRPPGDAALVRAAGQDFWKGELVLRAGTRLGPGQVALAAAANWAELLVRRRPRFSVVASGDELIAPGGVPDARQTIDAGSFGVAALLKAWGAAVTRSPVLPDTLGDATEAARALLADRPDVVVTIGGASVSHRDVLRPAFEAAGARLAFAGVALRPGKPFWHARANQGLIVGLPGNPASALVTARLFAVPLLLALSGESGERGTATFEGRLGVPLPPPGARETWHRARLDDAGRLMPDRREDSSLLSPFAHASHLVRQVPGEPLSEGAAVRFVALTDGYDRGGASAPRQAGG